MTDEILASDGDDVLPGIDPPSQEERLAYLAEWGFGKGDEVLLLDG